MESYPKSDKEVITMLSAISSATNNAAAVGAQYDVAQKTDTSKVVEENAKELKPIIDESGRPKTDSFVKTHERPDIGYGQTKGLSSEEIDALNEQRVSSMKNMIQKLISEQAGKATGNYTFTSFEFNMSIEFSTSSTAATSVESFYDDPVYGVDAMATKLMDMALSLSGGNSEKADLLMDAVYDGFSQAEAIWGDELPGVSQATLKEVENRFEYWKENGTMDGYEFQGYDILEDE